VSEEKVRSFCSTSMLWVITDNLQTISELQASWIWVADWIDSSRSNTARRVVYFTRYFSLASSATAALVHFSADMRYKLFINGVRVVVGLPVEA
jgi:hypothetical protein